MFVQIDGGELFNFSQVDTFSVTSVKKNNIIQMIFPSRMILYMSYNDHDRCLKAMESILNSYSEGKKTLNLMKVNLQPDSFLYDRVATKI